jgi:chaperonin GroES
MPTDYLRCLIDCCLPDCLPAQSAGGIFLPEAATKKNNEGTVVAVGPGKRTLDGTLVPMYLNVGDKVLLPEYGGSVVQIDDQEVNLFREEEILAKFE